MGEQGTLIILTGLPGSGKTTLARQLETERNAVRLCPDEWLEELAIHFDDESARARVEALQWRMAQRLLTLGGTVIIEWGTWARSERDQLREAARALGARVELRGLDAPLDTLFERISARGRQPPFARATLDGWAALYQRPDSDELSLYD